MNEIPWLTILTFLPAFFALAIAFTPKESTQTVRTIAMVGTLATLAVSLVLLALYAPGSGEQFQLRDQLNWIPSLKINYLMGIDGISLLMILMTTIIFPFAVGVSNKEITERVKQFFAWMLLMETMVLGVFCSLNLVLYYVFWEGMLIPMYFIIGIWGGSRRLYATIKFFLYTMVGSMVMLVSIMALYFLSGQASFDLPTLQRLISTGTVHFSTNAELLLFIGFFLAFGIKAPIWPFHTWVPDAYAEAPTGGTIILVALKMGLYGFIRFCLPLFPGAMQLAGPTIIVLAVVGVVYAALVASMQTDMKRLIAYSSVSHVGVIMLAIFALTGLGMNGAVLQMVAHTITTGALFILLGILYQRRKTMAIKDYGGLMAVMPVFTIIFLIATLSSIALPMTAGFSGEILMLMGSFQTAPWPTAIATTAAIWSAVYMLWMFQRVLHGPLDKDENKGLRDLTSGERLALVPLVILIFVLGLVPTLATKLSAPSVNTILTQSNLSPYDTPLPLPYSDRALRPAVAQAPVTRTEARP